MGHDGFVCPHPGCESPLRANSKFCPRCGRPVRADAVHADLVNWPATLGWLFVAFLACFLCLPCFFSSFGHPGGFVFLGPPVFFFWHAFKKRPPRIPR